MSRKALAGAALLALASCSPAIESERLCLLAPDALVSRALGAAGGPVTSTADLSAANVRCTWTSTAGEAGGRRMIATLHRHDEEGAITAFGSELKKLERTHVRTRLLGGVGEAAVIGFGEDSAYGFSGEILVRKGRDVLVVVIEGDDAGAFEEAVRAIVAKL